jgi:hypothetical protein
VPHPEPYPTCIFCGSEADSREHAIPAWIARRFGLKGVFLTEIETNMVPAKQPISVASFRKRIFCKDCNKHFKHLEDAVIPILKPMGLGQTRMISREEQQTLALWGVKTALAILAASRIDPRDLVPEANFSIVRYEGLPPKDAWVGFASWSGPTALFAGFLPWAIEDVEPASAGDAYQVLFCFGTVALKAVGFAPPGPAAPCRPGGQSAGLVSVWPESEQHRLLGWPPLVGRAWKPETWKTLFGIVPIRCD